MDINISVKDKIARGDGTVIVCGNSDYTVSFELDSEWDEYETKTMRTAYRNGEFEDVELSGKSFALPVIKNQPWISVGLYSGQLRTSTPAVFRCAGCITDGAAEKKPDAPSYKTLTIKLGDSIEHYEYTGLQDKTIEVEDGNGVSY